MKTTNVRQPQIYVVVVSDDPLRVIGLQSLLKSERRIRVTRENASESSGRVDVALVRDTGGDLAEKVSKLKNDLPTVRIIVMGSGVNEDTVSRALAVGASGYLIETASAAEIASAIRTVNQGLSWAPRWVIAHMIDNFAGATNRKPSGRDALTDREREVLKLLVEGRSNKEIAGPLEIEERTVKAHVSHMMRKLRVTNRIALSLLAVRESIVTAL
jgi:DNA-binding NarL/FixJ family response regulator